MRNQTEILQELYTINQYVLKGIPDSDIPTMLTAQSVLVTYLASTAALVAEAGKIHNQAKVKAYLALKTSSEANREYYSASLAKDYISARCGEEHYAYEYAQRMNSAVTHALDACRTAISTERAMLQHLNFQNHA
jgi:hypothetical protein